MRAPGLLAATVISALLGPGVAPTAEAQLPDLALEVSWAQVAGSHKVAFEITVSNVGAGEADPANTAIGLFNVLLFSDAAEQPAVDVGSIPDLETTLLDEPLAPGGSVALPFTFDYKAVGEYHAWVFTDSTSFSTDPLLSSLSLDEVTKDNNLVEVAVTVAEPTIEMPDLQIALFAAVVDGNKVTFNGKVVNAGDDDAGPFDITFFRHAATLPKTTALPDELIAAEGLEAGGTILFETVWEPAPNGSYLPWLCADYHKDDVLEHDEQNNCLVGQGYSVLLEGDFPDLTVAGFSSASSGADIVYTVTIANEGTGFANEFAVDMFFDADESPSCGTVARGAQAAKLIPALAVGSETELFFTWQTPPVGQHAAWVLVDCSNQLSELDETNNVAGPILVNITEADLAVVEMTAETQCSQVIWAVKIKNEGHFSAGAFEVKFFKNRPVNPGLEGFGDFDTTVDGLAPGEETTVIFDGWTDAEDGSYDTWVAINGDKGVEESNYANNMDSVFGVAVDTTGCGPVEEPAAPEPQPATAEPEPEPAAGSGERSSTGGCAQGRGGDGAPLGLLLLLGLLVSWRSAAARYRRPRGSF